MPFTDQGSSYCYITAVFSKLAIILSMLIINLRYFVY
jgi:hypothetical protein